MAFQLTKLPVRKRIGANWRLYAFLTIGLLIIIFLGYASLRYIQGYELIGDEKNAQIRAPSQTTYRNDSNIITALRFLSSRWNTCLDSLYILTERRKDVFTEIGVVDSASLKSARLLIATKSFPALQQLIQESIVIDNNLYLLNEFIPVSQQDTSIARKFYATMTPSLRKSQDFAVIIWSNISPSGNGDIKALTNSGYLTVPVIYGLVLKRFGYYVN